MLEKLQEMLSLEGADEQAVLDKIQSMMFCIEEAKKELKKLDKKLDDTDTDISFGEVCCDIQCDLIGVIGILSV